MLKFPISKSHTYLVALFFIIIIFSGLLMHIVTNSNNNLNENRNLAQRPALSLIESDPKTFFNDYNLFYLDHFPFRAQLIRLHGYILYHLFGVSSHKGVALGKNGMMFFFADNSGDPLGDYRGVNYFTDQELEIIKKNLTERRDALRKKGIDFYLFLTPNKESIYPENIPENIIKYENRNRYELLTKYLKEKSDINLVTVKEELLENKPKGYPLYFKTDSHWNPLGAFFAYDKFIKYISHRYRNIHALRLEDFQLKVQDLKQGGDLSRMLGLEKDVMDTYIDLTPRFVSGVQKNNILEDHNPGFENKDKSLLNIFFLCDSFTMYGLIPYMNESFHDTYFIWHSLPFNAAAMQNRHVDVMIYQIAERYIPMLLQPMQEPQYPLAR